MLLGCPVLEGMLFAVTMGYGLMMVWDVVLLYRYFPQSEESPWAFLRWVDAFLPLAFTGLCTNIGLFAHLVICWAGPSGVQVKGLFYGAPYYDVPALIAFLTILVTSVNFVVSVEVNFYPKYRNYYSLFNDGGVVGDIVTAEEEMLAVLNRELRFTALKQLFVTAAVLSLENTLLALLPLGFNDLMHGYFRTLCVGYGLYAVGNTILMILLYFTDYGGAVAAAAVFAVSASGLTALSMALDPAFYGFGFLIGAALFYLVTLFRLDVFTANLPYRVLGQQPIVAETKAGRFTRLGLFLEHKKRKPTKSAKHSAS
nr:exopolysaccharide Pel transporter PelG [Faecalibacterium prausnitzii]